MGYTLAEAKLILSYYLTTAAGTAGGWSDAEKNSAINVSLRRYANTADKRTLGSSAGNIVLVHDASWNHASALNPTISKTAFVKTPNRPIEDVSFKGTSATGIYKPMTPITSMTAFSARMMDTYSLVTQVSDDGHFWHEEGSLIYIGPKFTSGTLYYGVHYIGEPTAVVSPSDTFPVNDLDVDLILLNATTLLCASKDVQAKGAAFMAISQGINAEYLRTYGKEPPALAINIPKLQGQVQQ